MPLSRLRATSLGPAFVVVAVLASSGPAWGDVPVPACKGHSPKDAATAKAEGIKHYRASKREGRDDAEMAAALSFFEAACAAGDDSALELRAYALAGIERFVEAAQTLDAFLEAHPLESLPDATRERLSAQQPEILARVASLTIESPAPGAKVTINHQAAGVTPLPHLRLAPGRYDIEVTADGEPTIARSLDLTTGDRTESFGPPKVEIVEARPPPPPPRPTNDSGIKPPVIGAAAAGGVLLLAGIGGVIWANERAGVYNDAKCDGSTTQPGCSGALSQYDAARDLEIIGFVGAGLGAVGAGVLYYLGTKQGASPTSSGAHAHVSCSVVGAGAGCSGTF